MTFAELVNSRYSLRQFAPKAVEKEKLQAVMDVARKAPSACNFQPWKFVVVTDAHLLAGLVECYNREWFSKAPACIVAVGEHGTAWHRADGKDHCDVDVAIAVTHITLAAVEQGLGSCWVCNFDVQKCAQLLQLAEDEEPMALIPIGYAQENEVSEKKRKSLDEIVIWK